MEIKDFREKADNYFSDLSSGDVFEYDGELYMRISGCTTSTAVQLNTGVVTGNIPEHAVVEMVYAELNVYNPE